MEESVGCASAKAPSAIQEPKCKKAFGSHHITNNSLTLPQEYSPSLIIPISTVVNAVEIDPISKRKPFCMQIIGEEKSYRFCAADEDSLAKWLGAMKSILSKRKEAGGERANSGLK